LIFATRLKEEAEERRKMWEIWRLKDEEEIKKSKEREKKRIEEENERRRRRMEEEKQIWAKREEKYRLLKEKRRDLILKFNKIKFTKEECTANVLDIKAFIEFNNYIDKEIDFFSDAYSYPPSANLFAPIISRYNKEIIEKYIDFKNNFREGLHYVSDAEEDELFSQLYNIKFTIKREEKEKSDLMLKFDEIKFKKEKCTALLGFKGKCKKAIVEFNNYIDQEISYLSTNNSDNLFKDTLNKLSETISSSDEKKIMDEYITLRDKKNFIELGKSESLQHELFSYLQKIKSLILSL